MRQEMTAWQYHQLDHMQIICTLLQTDNHTNTSLLTLVSVETIGVTKDRYPFNAIFSRTAWESRHQKY